MDKIEKLFRRINKKDRLRIEEAIQQLLSGEMQSLDIKKVIDKEFYRIRAGNYRIIFQYREEKIIIETIRIKDDNTYKNLY